MVFCLSVPAVNSETEKPTMFKLRGGASGRAILREIDIPCRHGPHFPVIIKDNYYNNDSTVRVSVCSSDNGRLQRTVRQIRVYFSMRSTRKK